MTRPEPYYIEEYEEQNVKTNMVCLHVGGQQLEVSVEPGCRVRNLEQMRQFLDALYEAGWQAGRKEMM